MSTIVSPPSPIVVIDALAKKYSEARAKLEALCAEYNEAWRELRKKHTGGIKQAAAVATQRQAELAAEVGDHPDLFVKPRTLLLHGIKVGFQKGKGRIEWEDAEKVVQRIEVIFGPDASLYLRKSPSKDALLLLDAATLKKLGVTVEAAGDCVYIKAVDSDVDKLVAALLEEGSKEDA